MRKLEHFEKKRDYAVLRPVGLGSFDEMVEMVSRAVHLCRKEKIAKLLIDSTKLPGVRPTGIADRFSFAERIAFEAASSVKIAHVASPEWICLGKFSVLVAK